jgi:hypothetical protein
MNALESFAEHFTSTAFEESSSSNSSSDNCSSPDERVSGSSSDDSDIYPSGDSKIGMHMNTIYESSLRAPLTRSSIIREIFSFLGESDVWFSCVRSTQAAD